MTGHERCQGKMQAWDGAGPRERLCSSQQQSWRVELPKSFGVQRIPSQVSGTGHGASGFGVWPDEFGLALSLSFLWLCPCHSMLYTQFLLDEMEVFVLWH